MLLDLKFPDEAGYRRYCRGSWAQTQAFAALAGEKRVPLWVRHVVVPGLNDSLEDLRAIKAQAESLPGFQKLEWLPFHNMCLEKYQQLGLPFPLAGTPALEDKDLARSWPPFNRAPQNQRTEDQRLPSFFRHLRLFPLGPSGVRSSLPPFPGGHPRPGGPGPGPASSRPVTDPRETEGRKTCVFRPFRVNFASYSLWAPPGRGAASPSPWRAPPPWRTRTWPTSWAAL